MYIIKNNGSEFVFWKEYLVFWYKFQWSLSQWVQFTVSNGSSTGLVPDRLQTISCAKFFFIFHDTPYAELKGWLQPWIEWMLSSYSPVAPFTNTE